MAVIQRGTEGQADLDLDSAIYNPSQPVGFWTVEGGGPRFDTNNPQGWYASSWNVSSTGITATACIGNEVTITGQNLANAASVKFATNKSATIITNIATQIVVTVPQGTVTGAITVTTGAGTATSAADFTPTALATPPDPNVTINAIGNTATIAAITLPACADRVRLQIEKRQLDTVNDPNYASFDGLGPHQFTSFLGEYAAFWIAYNDDPNSSPILELPPLETKQSGKTPFALLVSPNSTFTITTDPVGTTGSSGTADGTRDQMKFEVVIEATSDGTLTPLPPVVALRLTRLAANERVDLTAVLEPDLTPRYRVTWDITHLKGRWSIAARDYPSNIAVFKIDKRSQIVQVADSWEGFEISSSTNCFKLVAYK